MSLPEEYYLNELIHKKTIRVAVSGDIRLNRLELKIIDTPIFQRLRKLKQLGTSHLIYPSANHTRFEHSLGVLNMAEKIVQAIKTNKSRGPEYEHENLITNRQHRLIRLVALLHDIGNIPFGHTLEDEASSLNSKQDDINRIKDFLVPGENEQDQNNLGFLLKNELGVDYSFLIDLLAAKEDPSNDEKTAGVKSTKELNEDAFIVDIVKNTVCADLLDYLKRDSYFCFLPITIPDRFLDYFYIHSFKNDKDVVTSRRIAIRLWHQKEKRPRKALISELIQLLEARYSLTERVYYHHAKQISSAMISSALFYALNPTTSTEKLEPKDIYKWGDEDFIRELKNEIRFPVSCKIITDYEKRILYDSIYYISADALAVQYAEDFEKLHKSAAERSKIEKFISNIVNLNLGELIVYCPNQNMNMKLADVLVTQPNVGVDRLQNYSNDHITKQKIESILESYKQLWGLHVFIKPSLLSQKIDIIKNWCEAIFEGDDFSRERAYQVLMVDILRELSIDIKIFKIDILVATTIKLIKFDLKTISRERFSAISRFFIITEINPKDLTNKTEKELQDNCDEIKTKLIPIFNTFEDVVEKKILFFKVYCWLSEAYSTWDLKEAKMYLREAKKNIEKLNAEHKQENIEELTLEHKQRIRLLEAKYNNQDGNHEEALNTLNELIAEITKENEIKGEAFLCRGDVFKSIKNIETAIVDYQKAEGFFELVSSWEKALLTRIRRMTIKTDENKAFVLLDEKHLTKIKTESPKVAYLALGYFEEKSVESELNNNKAQENMEFATVGNRKRIIPPFKVFEDCIEKARRNK